MKQDEQGTPRIVLTHSEYWPVIVLGTGETPRARQTTTPTGESTFTTGCFLKEARKDGTVRTDRKATISVLKPLPVYEDGVRYRAQGREWSNKWGSDGWGVEHAVIVEELVPLETKPTEDSPAPLTLVPASSTAPKTGGESHA